MTGGEQADDDPLGQKVAAFVGVRLVGLAHPVLPGMRQASPTGGR